MGLASQRRRAQIMIRVKWSYCRLFALLRSLSLALFCAASGPSQVQVLTANYGLDRTNANLEETKLTPGNVTPGSFGALGAFPTDGQVFAQPLYVSNLIFPNQGARNVLFIATEHNSVYAYDADATATPVLLWRVNLGPTLPSPLDRKST